MRTASRQTLLVIVSIAISFAAYADIGAIGGSAIGKIGSPVVPSNLPKQPAKNNATSGQEDGANADNDKGAGKELSLPLLTILFNQNHVDFGQALKQTIIENEKNSPGMIYEVVSNIPNNSANPSKAARLNTIYTENLNSVVRQMLAFGLPQNRIHTSTAYKDDGSDQDVSIYGAPQ